MGEGLLCPESFYTVLSLNAVATLETAESIWTILLPSVNQTWLEIPKNVEVSSWENDPSMVDFPAMLDYQRVTVYLGVFWGIAYGCLD